MPVEDPPTSTAIPLLPSAAARTTRASSASCSRGTYAGSTGSPGLRVLGLHRPVHLQRERVGHLLERPPRHRAR